MIFQQPLRLVGCSVGLLIMRFPVQSCGAAIAGLDHSSEVSPRGYEPGLSSQNVRHSQSLIDMKMMFQQRKKQIFGIPRVPAC